MARPQVADREDGFQIWRVAADILNKQSRTADKGWSYSLRAGFAAKTPHCKKAASYEILHRASDFDDIS
jgi:hypothetical protein